MRTLKPPSSRRLTAAMIALALLGSACGSRTQETATDAGDGPEYGDSLTEWLQAIGDERDAAAEAWADDVDMTGYKLLTWEDLVPAGYSGGEIYDRYADRLAKLQDGSPEADAIYEEMQAEFDQAPINPDLDGTPIQLAGFVAPLNYEDEVVTEFLLVPYFGSCIHFPPPPPNQTVLVTLQEGGLTIEESWGAVMVAGTLTTDTATTDLADASYTITGATSTVYEDY